MALTVFFYFRAAPSIRPRPVTRDWPPRSGSRRFSARKRLATWFLAAAVLTAVGCHDDGEVKEKPRPAARAEPRHVPQVQPPIDVKAPPMDAPMTSSGL